MEKYSNQEYWNKLLLTELPMPKEDIKEWLKAYAAPYKELMAYYRCAMMEVETKFRVLNEELSLEYDRNPIETIKTRLKSVESIGDKLSGMNKPITVESIEENLKDVDVLICGGIGGGAQMALAQAGIKLYGGVCGDADKAAEAFVSGELRYDPDAKCDHHDHGEGHTCGEHSCGNHSCH